MFFLTPTYLKQGRSLLKEARKLLSYKRDVWSKETISEYQGYLDGLLAALRARDRRGVADAGNALAGWARVNHPVPSDAGWRENVEVFLVAIVIALGVRTYFLQPFGIPTGSMQPTLNGIIGTKLPGEVPTVFVRIFDGVWHGRASVDLVAKEDEIIRSVQEIKSPLPFISHVPGFRSGFFTRTEIATERGNQYIVSEGLSNVTRLFGVMQGASFKKGEPIARGYFDAGDHVFVDKFTYHFRNPRRSEVFVFSTLGISMLNPAGAPSQFYIKRLGGVPGDTMRIDPPNLYINGKLAEEQGFRKVMSGTRTPWSTGYRGYGNGAERPNNDQQFYVDRAYNLGTPTATVTLPPKTYYALGDNSYNSLDSRFWGTVPERNVMGKAVVVYWPFGKHLGPVW